MLMQANTLRVGYVLGRCIKLTKVYGRFYFMHQYYTDYGYNVTNIGSAVCGIIPNTDEYGHGTRISTNILGISAYGWLYYK